MLVLWPVIINTFIYQLHSLFVLWATVHTFTPSSCQWCVHWLFWLNTHFLCWLDRSYTHYLTINLWESELTFLEWPGSVVPVTALLSLFCQWSSLAPTPSEEWNEGVVNGLGWKGTHWNVRSLLAELFPSSAEPHAWNLSALSYS